MFLFIYVTALWVQAHWWWWWHAVFSRCGCDVSSSIITSVESKATYRSTTKNISSTYNPYSDFTRYDCELWPNLWTYFVCVVEIIYVHFHTHTHTVWCIIIILCCVRTFFLFPRTFCSYICVSSLNEKINLNFASGNQILFFFCLYVYNLKLIKHTFL